ncbi:MAG: hypothetical protein PUE08_06920 [Eubacteriales bacterium]|nr:hypothetical protein [Eubacteriales bacterium]
MKKSICILMCIAVLCSSFLGCSKEDESESVTPVEVNDLKITVDAHYSDMDESAVRVYEKLCNAVINHETEIKFNTSLTDSVNQLFYTSFPLYALVDGVEYLEDKTGVSISYKYEAEEHQKKVDEFKTAVSEIMSKCSYGSVSANQYLLNLYTYIATNVTIDNTVTTVMDTIINKKGISASISGMFEYLLLQADISASHIINTDSASIARMLSMAEFNGGTFYFDPALEISENSGSGLMYFAMNTKRAVSSCGGSLAFTDNTEPDEIIDTAYSVLEKCTSYTVEGNEVIASCKGEDDFKFTLS